jgi:hypothetical protein
VKGEVTAAGPGEGTAAGEVAQHLSARLVHVEAIRLPSRHRRSAPIWSPEAKRWLAELGRRLRTERALR